MIRIVVINVKGGCGKSTISTNLASLYASRGFQTALYDYDEQSSSMRWLEARPPTVPSIYGVTAHPHAARGVTRSWHMRVPPDVSRLIVDTPPGLKGPALAQLRDTQNYNRVSRAGLGIHEINHQAVDADKKHWQAIFSWIETNAKNKRILQSIRQQGMALQAERDLRNVS